MTTTLDRIITDLQVRVAGEALRRAARAERDHLDGGRRKLRAIEREIRRVTGRNDLTRVSTSADVATAAEQISDVAWRVTYVHTATFVAPDGIRYVGSFHEVRSSEPCDVDFVTVAVVVGQCCSLPVLARVVDPRTHLVALRSVREFRTTGQVPALFHRHAAAAVAITSPEPRHHHNRIVRLFRR